MTAWQVYSLANMVIAVSYLGIAVAILAPLIRTRQLRSNRLGAATAAIFFTCAVHHAAHPVHLLLMPTIDMGHGMGMSMRTAVSWQAAGWDVVGMAVAVYYWSLRRSYGPLMQGAALFADLRERRRQALELNDNVVQGLTVAHIALSMNERERSLEAVEATLASARQLITSLLGDTEQDGLGPGDLVRRRPASLGVER